MILFIGGETLIHTRDIVGIFDFDNATASKWTRKTLQTAEREGRVFETSSELPRSFILTSTRFGPQIYLSHLSAATLRERAETAFSSERSFQL